ncbi:MAG: hypothetical protein MJE77_46315, partial [Proteobacteria bacterium]|nr:hypothetical protein [Pseudomonadota bacterium]
NEETDTFAFRSWVTQTTGFRSVLTDLFRFGWHLHSARKGALSTARLYFVRRETYLTATG